MKYNNKYALALVLLASSAFASGSTYDVLATDIANHFGSGKHDLTDFSPSSGSPLTPDQIDLVNGMTEENRKNKNELIPALRRYDAKVKAKKSAEEIIAIAGSGPISRKPLNDYSSHLNPKQYHSIAEYEYKTGNVLTEDELAKLLRIDIVPDCDNTPDTAADRIIKLANGGKISDITDERYKYDLNDYEINIIKKVENILAAPLSKDQLTKFLTNNNFRYLDEHVRVKAILATGPDELHYFVTEKQDRAIELYETQMSRKAEEFLAKVLKATDNELDDMIAML